VVGKLTCRHRVRGLARSHGRSVPCARDRAETCISRASSTWRHSTSRGRSGRDRQGSRLITPGYARLIAASPLVTLAVGPEGVDGSPSGHGPVFVRILDDRTLACRSARETTASTLLRNLIATSDAPCFPWIPDRARRLASTAVQGSRSIKICSPPSGRRQPPDPML
jgi:hypothetical protein